MPVIGIKCDSVLPEYNGEELPFDKCLSDEVFRGRRINWRVDIETGCWTLLKATKENGYTNLTFRNKYLVAHRLFFERFKHPIPEGMVIDHLCRNKSCVNPLHLEATTHTENVRRGPATKLTQTEVLDLRNDYATGNFTQRQLANKYEISRTHVGTLIRGESWSDIGGYVCADNTASGFEHYKSKLTPETAHEVYVSRGKESVESLAAKFGVKRGTIYRVWREPEKYAVNRSKM